MQVQVNSDHNIEGSAGLQNWVASVVEDRLDRFDELLTRVEVHLNDENAGKSGAQDKRCQMEARIKGHQPLSVTHKAESLEQAVDGAADKLHRAISNLSGKLEKKRLSGGELNDPWPWKIPKNSRTRCGRTNSSNGSNWLTITS